MTLGPARPTADGRNRGGEILRVLISRDEEMLAEGLAEDGRKESGGEDEIGRPGAQRGYSKSLICVLVPGRVELLKLHVFD